MVTENGIQCPKCGSNNCGSPNFGNGQRFGACNECGNHWALSSDVFILSEQKRKETCAQ